MNKKTIHIILGPTASGKESTAYELAQLVGGEIVSVDSMKIYRTLDIGTAKASADMRRTVPHHCLDIAQPEDDFSAGQYQQAADTAIDDITRRGKPVILSGGTAFYYKAVLEGLFEAPPKDEALREELKQYAAEHGNETLFERLKEKDPAAANKLHANDIRRVIRALEVFELTGEPISSRQQQWSGFHDEAGFFNGELRYDFRMVWLDWERDELYRRIEKRVDIMLEKGIEAEAKVVYDHRDTYSRTPLQAVGYKEFFPYFAGEMPLEEAVDVLKKNTRHLAKSQCTWFRKFPAQRIEMQKGVTAKELAIQIAELWGLIN